MKVRRVRLSPIALAAVAAIGALQAAPQQEEATQPEMSPEAQAEMEAWMKLAEPGEHHQHLAPYEGKWKAQMKMWMAPDTEPMLNEAEAEAAWIMGGRFLEWKFTGDFSGMPYEGRGIEGFNNGDGRYETMWLDNFGTLIVRYTGDCSDDGKSRVMKGQFNNPMDESTIHQKMVYTWIDDDHFKYEMFMKQGELEYKNMEMLYERQ